MYLAQAKHTAGHSRRRHRRPRTRPRSRVARAHGLDGAALRRPIVRRGREDRSHPHHRRRALAHRGARGRDRHRGHRPPGSGHPARARIVRPRQARGDGQRRGRRARRPAPRAPCAGRGGRVFARLRRPAGADLRDGRLVPRRGLRRRRGRQGHQVPPRVPRIHARHRVAVLRLLAGAGSRRRFQRAHVQFVSRRHQERDRNGGGGECDRIDARTGRASPFRLAVSTTCLASCARRTKAGSSATLGRWK